MDFSEALKALKDGKKVKRHTWQGSYLILDGQIRRVFDFQGSETFIITKEFLFADDWEIMPNLEKATVKTKIIEYVKCPRCKKELEITEPHNNYRYCGFCGKEMELERPKQFIGYDSGLPNSYVVATLIDGDYYIDIKEIKP